MGSLARRMERIVVERESGFGMPKNKKTEEQDQKSLSSVSVPGAGIEPARPLLATGF